MPSWYSFSWREEVRCGESADIVVEHANMSLIARTIRDDFGNDARLVAEGCVIAYLWKKVLFDSIFSRIIQVRDGFENVVYEDFPADNHSLG